MRVNIFPESFITDTILSVIGGILLFREENAPSSFMFENPLQKANV